MALSTWEIAGWVEDALERCEARRHRRPGAAGGARRGWAWSTAPRRCGCIHLPETMAEKERARRRLAFDELLRVQTVLVMRKRALERELAGHPPRRRRRAGRPAAGGAAVRAHRRAATGHRRDRGRPRRPAPDAPPAAGRRRRRQDVGGRQRDAHRRAGWAPGRADGAHRGARRAARRRACAGCSHGVTVPDPGNLFGDRPLRVELLTNRVTGGDRRDVLAGLADGTVDIAIGTHALIQEGVQFHSLGVVVVDEQHRFGVEQRAALRAKGDGDAGARRAGDDRHADPAHRGDDRVRRPRRERARRAAARPHADRHPLGQRSADGAGRVGRRARARWPPAGRRTWCAR